MSIINKNLWQEILEEGERIGIVKTKKRGIIREFLQSQILYYLYNFKESRYLVFNGGTALRFLYNNQRLSEDLDFDLLKKIPLENILKEIINKQTLGKTYLIDFKIKSKGNNTTAYFKYKNLLYDLGINSAPDQKLVVKFDFSVPEDKVNPVNKTFLKFGYLQNVLTYDPSTLLSFKTRALFQRKAERGRDLYDIAKLLSINIKPNFDIKFFKRKSVKNFEEYKLLLKKWYKDHKKVLPQLKKQLLPFLINEKEINYLEFLFKL